MSRTLLSLAALALIGASPRGDDPPAPKLAMTPAIPCVSIAGFEDFVPLDEVVLTRDEKLLLYYKPRNYRHEVVGKEYRVHLVEDARIRRKGEKAVIQSKDKLLEYKGKSKQFPANVYLTNSISLKPLPPGEYDLEIILRDEIGKGPPATQTVRFRVKAAPAAGSPAESKDKATEKAKGKDPEADPGRDR